MLSRLCPHLTRTIAAFGLQASCLRFAPAVTGPDARLGPSPGVACTGAGGTCYAAAPTQLAHWKAPTWPGARYVPHPRARPV
jgi:hypothetical protein